MWRRSGIVLAGLFIVLAVVLVLIVGPGANRASNGTAPAGTTTRIRTTTTAPTPAPPATTTVSRRGSGEAVTFAFGGDVHFEGNLRAQLASNPGGMFAPIAPTLSAADVAMVNLETAITERGTPEPKQYTFRAPPAAFGALQGAGIDVVTMANNHGRDYGAVGLADTLAAKATSPIPVLGIGANANEAYAPWRTTIKGQRIAIFGMTDVLDDALIPSWTATDTQGGLASTKGANEARAVAAIAAVRPEVDTVVVYLHWGVEGSTCPTPRQQQLAQTLIAAGADIVVGSHAHRVAGGGRLGAAFVDYGLGNFVFYNESGASGETGVLTVTATGRDIDAYRWIPARIQGGIPHVLSGAAQAQASAAWDAKRACTGLTP